MDKLFTQQQQQLQNKSTAAAAPGKTPSIYPPMLRSDSGALGTPGYSPREGSALGRSTGEFLRSPLGSDLSSGTPSGMGSHGSPPAGPGWLSGAHYSLLQSAYLAAASKGSFGDIWSHYWGSLSSGGPMENPGLSSGQTMVPHPMWAQLPPLSYSVDGYGQTYSSLGGIFPVPSPSQLQSPPSEFSPAFFPQTTGMTGPGPALSPLAYQQRLQDLQNGMMYGGVKQDYLPMFGPYSQGGGSSILLSPSYPSPTRSTSSCRSFSAASEIEESGAKNLTRRKITRTPDRRDVDNDLMLRGNLMERKMERRGSPAQTLRSPKSPDRSRSPHNLLRRSRSPLHSTRSDLFHLSSMDRAPRDHFSRDQIARGSLSSRKVADSVETKPFICKTEYPMLDGLDNKVSVNAQSNKYKKVTNVPVNCDINTEKSKNNHSPLTLAPTYRRLKSELCMSDLPEQNVFSNRVEDNVFDLSESSRSKSVDEYDRVNMNRSNEPSRLTDYKPYMDCVRESGKSSENKGTTNGRAEMVLVKDEIKGIDIQSYDCNGSASKETSSRYKGVFSADATHPVENVEDESSGSSVIDVGEEVSGMVERNPLPLSDDSTAVAASTIPTSCNNKDDFIPEKLNGDVLEVKQTERHLQCDTESVRECEGRRYLHEGCDVKKYSCDEDDLGLDVCGSSVSSSFDSSSSRLDSTSPMCADGEDMRCKVKEGASVGTPRRIGNVQLIDELVMKYRMKTEAQKGQGVEQLAEDKEKQELERGGANGWSDDCVMRYQVSHNKTGCPSHVGGRVHAHTYLPEVGTPAAIPRPRRCPLGSSTAPRPIKSASQSEVTKLDQNGVHQEQRVLSPAVNLPDKKSKEKEIVPLMGVSFNEQKFTGESEGISVKSNGINTKVDVLSVTNESRKLNSTDFANASRKTSFDKKPFETLEVVQDLSMKNEQKKTLSDSSSKSNSAGLKKSMSCVTGLNSFEISSRNIPSNKTSEENYLNESLDLSTSMKTEAMDSPRIVKDLTKPLSGGRRVDGEGPGSAAGLDNLSVKRVRVARQRSSSPSTPADIPIGVAVAQQRIVSKSQDTDNEAGQKYCNYLSTNDEMLNSCTLNTTSGMAEHTTMGGFESQSGAEASLLRSGAGLVALPHEFNSGAVWVGAAYPYPLAVLPSGYVNNTGYKVVQDSVTKQCYIVPDVAWPNFIVSQMLSGSLSSVYPQGSMNSAVHRPCRTPDPVDFTRAAACLKPDDLKQEDQWSRDKDDVIKEGIKKSPSCVFPQRIKALDLNLDIDKYYDWKSNLINDEKKLNEYDKQYNFSLNGTEYQGASFGDQSQIYSPTSVHAAEKLLSFKEKCISSASSFSMIHTSDISDAEDDVSVVKPSTGIVKPVTHILSASSEQYLSDPAISSHNDSLYNRCSDVSTNGRWQDVNECLGIQNTSEEKNLSSLNTDKSLITSAAVEVTNNNLTESNNIQNDGISKDFKASSPSESFSALDLLSSVALSHSSTSSTTTIARLSKSSLPVKKRITILNIPVSELLEEVNKSSPDISQSYNAPARRVASNSSSAPSVEWTISSPTPSITSSHCDTVEKCQTEETMRPASVFNRNDGLENMDATEIDMRLKLAALQVKYRQNQKELARLQRRSGDSVRSGSSSVKKSKSTGKPSSVSKKISRSAVTSLVNSDSDYDVMSDSETLLETKIEKRSENQSIERSNDRTCMGSDGLSKERDVQASYQFASVHKSDENADLLLASKVKKKLFTKEGTEARDILSSARAQTFKVSQDSRSMTHSVNHSLESDDKKQSMEQNSSSSRSKSRRLNSVSTEDWTDNEENGTKESTGLTRFTDELYRRRSERIFLHDVTSTDPAHKNLDSSLNQSQRITQRAVSLDCVTGRGRTLCSKSDKLIQKRSESSRSHSSDSDSDGEGEKAPSTVNTSKHDPYVMRSCVIEDDDVSDGVQILFLKDDLLFYEARVREILPPDVYGVVIEGERGNKPNIMSHEDLLNHAVLVIRPTSVKQLSDGARVCAYWSQKFNCLYPGTVRHGKKGWGGSSADPRNANLVFVQFDDGDRGRIPLEHIRMLPPDYPILDDDTGLKIVNQNWQKTKKSKDSEKRNNSSNQITSPTDKSDREKSNNDRLQGINTKHDRNSRADSGLTSTYTMLNGIDRKLNQSNSRVTNSSNESNGSIFFNGGNSIMSKPKNEGDQALQPISPSFDKFVRKIESNSTQKCSTPKLNVRKNEEGSVNISATLSQLSRQKNKADNKTSQSSLSQSAKCSNSDSLKINTSSDKANYLNNLKRNESNGQKTFKSNGGSELKLKICKTEKDSNERKPSWSSSRVSHSDSSSDDDDYNGDNSDDDIAKSTDKKSSKEKRIKTKKMDNDSSVFKSDSDSDESSIDSYTFDDQSFINRNKKTYSKNQRETAATESDESEDESEKRSNRERSQKRKRIITASYHQNPSKRKKRRKSSPEGSKYLHNALSSSEEELNADESIGGFLPVWMQWQWVGSPTKRPGRRGRARKQFYKAIRRGNETIHVGEAAVFISTGRISLQYVGLIESLWETWDGNMVVKVKWFYHPEETKGGKKLAQLKGALYQSPHEDENDVQTISHKCRVVSFTEFERCMKERQQEQDTAASKKQRKLHSERGDDIFYLAGSYEPVLGMITFEPDVKVLP